MPPDSWVPRTGGSLRRGVRRAVAGSGHLGVGSTCARAPHAGRMSNKEPGDMFDHPERPTSDQPLNGPRRSTAKPLLLTVVVFAVLIVLYFLGTFVVNLD